MVKSKKYLRKKLHHFILESLRSGESLCLLITVNYREAYDMFACNGILFNHESLDVAKHSLRERLLVALPQLNWDCKNVYTWEI